MTLLILGIIIAAVGMIGALYNMVTGVSDVFSDERDPFESFGSTFKRHALWGALLVVGVALALIGLVLVIV
jgi:uncharacterized BrkB/YihY/UPF0761 family membrane protein